MRWTSATSRGAAVGGAWLWGALVVAGCHAAPLPEVAPSSPPLGPSDASEASSTTPQPATPPLGSAPSEPEPGAPADMPSDSPELAPGAPSVTPPGEPPTVSPPAMPVPPDVTPEPPSPPETSREPSRAPAAAAAPAPQNQGYTGDQPCQAKTFHVKAVEKACREGGRSAAKALMKQAIANAKAKGVSLKCTSCHVDQKTYGLQADAVKELQRWL